MRRKKGGEKGQKGELGDRGRLWKELEGVTLGCIAS